MGKNSLGDSIGDTNGRQKRLLCQAPRSDAELVDQRQQQLERRLTLQSRNRRARSS